MPARPLFGRTALLIAALAALAAAPVAADPGDDLLTRAIAAAGGEDHLAAARAFEWKATAVIHTSEKQITIAGVWKVEPPDRAEVATYETDRGPETTRRLILGGSRGLIERDGQKSPMPDGMLAEERHQFYLYWLLQLLPLRDPETHLVFSREDAAGRTAVRVSRAGRPDVTMLFDKQARVVGLRTVFATSDDPRPVQEIALSGSIEASGVRWFRRMAITRDGKPYYEMALTSLKTIPGLPDSADKVRKVKRRRLDPKLRITPSTGNVFRDIGFAAEESAHLLVRSDLMIQVQKLIASRRLTQVQVAKVLHVTQPRVSNLLRGRVDLFSTDALLDMLARLGVRVRFVLKPSRGGLKVA